MPSDNWYYWQGDILHCQVRVQTRARMDAIKGIHDGRLLVRINAPPVDGKANKRLLQFLAVSFGVSTGHIAIIRGTHSRNKTLQVSGLDPGSYRFPLEIQ